MKKYTSVFMLIVRSSIYPALGIIVGIMLGEVILFQLNGIERDTLYAALSDGSLRNSAYILIVMLSATLGRVLTNRGGQINHTLHRLAISEKQTFALQATYNTAVFLIAFMMQGLMFLVLSLWYGSVHPETMNQQTIFFTAYQYPMFHTFFPLDNAMAIFSLLLLALGLGICIAAYPMRQRHGKKSLTTFLMVFLALLYISLQNGNDHMGYDAAVFIFLSAIFCITISLCGVLSLEVDDYE